ncbi:MAG: DMT family transporter [Firmicutes bacterium]|nr:DMT family transporter [Bacillota bacterium]
MKTRSRWVGPISLILAASAWGGMYVVSKVLLTEMSAPLLMWIRYLIALVVLGFALVLRRASWRVEPQHVLLVAAIGVIGYVISIGAQFVGTALSTAQMGSVVTAATPAFMVVFARLIRHEPITLRRALSLGAATLGVLVIAGIGPLGSRQAVGGLILGAAALTWALMSVMVKQVPHTYSPLLVTFYGMLVAWALLTPAALGPFVRMLPRLTQWGTLEGLLYVGVVATAGAFFLWNQGVQAVSAAAAGIYFFLQPVVGTLLGWLVLKEPIRWGFLAGSILIVVGALLLSREGRSGTLGEALRTGPGEHPETS